MKTPSELENTMNKIFDVINSTHSNREDLWMMACALLRIVFENITEDDRKIRMQVLEKLKDAPMPCDVVKIKLSSLN